MELTPQEQQWLTAYGNRLQEEFPDLVQRLIVFGSKARGDWTADPDLHGRTAAAMKHEVARKRPRAFRSEHLTPNTH